MITYEKAKMMVMEMWHQVVRVVLGGVREKELDTEVNTNTGME